MALTDFTRRLILHAFGDPQVAKEIADAIEGATDASLTEYDNTASGLSATNVKDAIDEVAAASGGGGGGGSSDTQQIDIVLKKYSNGATVATRRAILTKTGNICTLVIEPMGGADASTPITIGTTEIALSTIGGVSPDQTPIPVGYRPKAGVGAVWVIEKDDGSVTYTSLIRVNDDGSIDIAHDVGFVSAFPTAIGGFYYGVATWTVDDFT